MHTMKMATAAVAIAFTATAGGAATLHNVALSGVSGYWTETSPENVYGLTGEGTRELRWGYPSTMEDVQNKGEKSGYGFDGSAGGTSVSAGSDFAIGTFTHFNNRIHMLLNQPWTISNVDLVVETSVQIGSTQHVFSSVFSFSHDETPNSASQCAYGGTPGAGVNGSYGCNDRVTASLNESANNDVIVDGVKYSFDFSGFEYNDGVFDYFDTVEEQTNEAVLLGRFNAELLPGETLTPVPLPAAGWMLIAGLGGLAAMKRRKSRSNA